MLYFFPPDILDEIWDLIESASEGFPTYFLRGFNKPVPYSADFGHLQLFSFAYRLGTLIHRSSYP